MFADLVIIRRQLVDVSPVPPGSSGKLSGQIQGGGDLNFSFYGEPGYGYVLYRCSSLIPSSWMPQVTDSPMSGGVAIFTNIPHAGTNNFLERAGIGMLGAENHIQRIQPTLN
jgi:hypothetical protein